MRDNFTQLLTRLYLIRECGPKPAINLIIHPSISSLIYVGHTKHLKKKKTEFHHFGKGKHFQQLLIFFPIHLTF